MVYFSLTYTFLNSTPCRPTFHLPVLESVRLEGYIVGPATGTVVFQATADDLFRLTVDGSTIMDTVSSEGGSSSSILTGETEMRKVSACCVVYKSDEFQKYDGDKP